MKYLHSCASGGSLMITGRTHSYYSGRGYIDAACIYSDHHIEA
jgi:2,4-dienoyl-CoA reductase-like NADH-dependent reductase (Old Yellow Enzyme family)